MAFDFRKEEDVKQYLHNIGIEYRFGCYSEKKPEGKISCISVPDSIFLKKHLVNLHQFLV